MTRDKETAAMASKGKPLSAPSTSEDTQSIPGCGMVPSNLQESRPDAQACLRSKMDGWIDR